MGIPALAEEKGLYTPGTYSATATGMGDVTVTMTFDANAITNVVVDTSKETTGFGLEKGGEFAERILAAQSAEIDAVSGVTVTSNAVIDAAKACIAQAKGETVEIAPVVEGAAADEGDWLGEEPETPAVDQVIDVDVVVVGAGLSGVCAARAAAEEGARVAVIEKCASFN